MPTDEVNIKEAYRQALKRAAWRLQYHVKTQTFREPVLMIEDKNKSFEFENEVVSELFVKDLIEQIPSSRCRYIIEKIIIEGMTEQEVSNELKISQQAVSKWKRKAITILRKKIGHL